MDFFPFFSNIFPMSVQKDYVLLHHTTSFVFLNYFLVEYRDTSIQF